MNNKMTAVCGFGKTGQALLEYLLAHEGERRPLLFTDEPLPPSAQDAQRRFAAAGVEFLNGEDFPRLQQASTVILSPGINGWSPRFDALRQAHIEIVSEIEYACRQIASPIIAVTGANGKSTTVCLIHHLLQTAGQSSVLAGNIGTPLVSLLGQIGASDPVVLEVSSFQLEEIVRFRPHIALLLNITPDHLDRYPVMDDYIRAKLNIFRNQTEDDFMILNVDDPWSGANRTRLLADGRAQALWFSRKRRPQGRGAFWTGDAVEVKVNGEWQPVSLRRNPLTGVHNLENIMAAFLAAAVIGVSGQDLETGLASFRGLEHRMQAVGRIGDVEFINDSKATNVDAALKSLISIPAPMVIILGGKDKGGDFSVLAEPLRQRAAKILLLGKAAPLIAGQLRTLAERFVPVRDLREAVATGYRILHERGGVVLLAPGCASFDMFDNFEHRGRVFAAEVRALREQTAHG